MIHQTSDETRLPRLAFTRAEAAQSLGLSLRKFDDMLKDKNLNVPQVRIDRKIVIPIDALKTWLIELEQKQAAAINRSHEAG